MTSATAPNQEPPELETFASDYNVVGGLRSHASTQRYLARRRSDGQDVVITIARVVRTMTITRSLIWPPTRS